MDKVKRIYCRKIDADAARFVKCTSEMHMQILQEQSCAENFLSAVGCSTFFGFSWNRTPQIQVAESDGFRN